MKITDKEIEITISELVDLGALPIPLYLWLIKCLEKVSKVTVKKDK